MNQYYQVLGLNQNASQEEIKKAYKKLALIHHPDKGGSEDTFKRISEAYQILTNKKEQPQQPQSNPFNGFHNFNNFHRNIKAKNILYNVEISLEEAFFGIKKNILVNKKVVCKNCNGEGGLDKVLCNQCGGGGALLHGNIIYMCNNCMGKGFLFTKKCGSCAIGYRSESINLEFDIKPGIKNDSNIVRQNIGNEILGGTNGDVILNVKIKKHEQFELDGHDLKVNKNISIIDIFLGTEINLKTLDSEVKVKIPRFSDPNKSFRLKNMGMKKENNTRGDLFINITPKYPTEITPQEEALLNVLKNSPNFKTV
jgi:molecular chaperone DnaJ